MKPKKSGSRTGRALVALVGAALMSMGAGVSAEEDHSAHASHASDASGASAEYRSPDHAHAKPTAHAPIGVMADHVHPKGGVMLSYRYMRMGMDDLMNNDDGISRRKVLQDFMVTPTRMDMQMHMIGAMVAPIDRVTLMVMIPYLQNEMDHRTRSGVTFTTRSQGIGDVRVSALIDLWHDERHRIHANLGIGFPTGSITAEDKTPASGGSKVRLPYPMQLGSGSYELLPGLTYNGYADPYSWGAQVLSQIRLNENHAGYRLGDEYELTAWGARELADWVSASLRFAWHQNVNISGREQSSSVNPNMVPTADPGRQAAMRLDTLFGFNFVVPGTPLAGTRFAIEAGLPIYQRVDGPQLGTSWIMTVGAQYAF
jgi:hypothetical protein